MKILSANQYISQNRSQNYQKNSVNFSSMLVSKGDFSDFQRLYPQAVSLGDKLKGIWFRRVINRTMRPFADNNVFKIEKKHKTQDVFMHPEEDSKFAMLLDAVAKEIGVEKNGFLVKFKVNRLVSDETFRVRWTDRLGACGEFRNYVESLIGNADKVERTALDEHVAKLEQVSQPVYDSFAKAFGSEIKN